MTTRFVGLKEFRANIVKITRDAGKKKQRVIVTSRNLPMFEVNPLLVWDDEGVYKEEFVRGILEAQEQVRRGEVYTTEELRKSLGLQPSKRSR